VRIEQLENVAAVIRLGSYRKAAEDLHMSQPALSESIRSLERELGVTVLERGRHGARLSRAGRDLLPDIRAVLDSFDRLRQAADAQHRSARVVRVGTVNAATVPVLAAALREFRRTNQATEVEVIGIRQAEIHDALADRSLDIGLVNYLDDDRPGGLETTTLLQGRPVVCMRPDSPLAARDTIQVSDLRAQPLIVMRSGYFMHQYLRHLLRDEIPPFACSADGAEMGKVLVAQGLGVTVLPDFSVTGDPLEQSGAITSRPLADDDTRVQLVVQRLRAGSPPSAATDLYRIFVERARALTLPRQKF
jgi:DNA-binding transcriptional LysR family regulator